MRVAIKYVCKECGKEASGYPKKQLCPVHYQLNHVTELNASARLGFCACGKPVIRKGACISCYDKDWRPEYRSGVRDRVIQAYGSKCACLGCSETNTDFYTIDHINQDGADHRRTLKSRGGINFWRWIELQGYPLDEYQLLCYNYNMGRERFKGRCPHV